MKKNKLISLAKNNYSSAAVQSLELAVDFATNAHKGQKRKSGEDFISHPINVAAILIEWQMDIDTVIAGVLHDTVEDCNVSIGEISKAFGESVAFLVDGVTKMSKARSGMNDISTYLPRTKDSLSKLLVAVSQDIRVLLVKMADRLHNMRTLQYLSADKQKKIARETQAIFAPLADRIGFGTLRVELEELSFYYIDADEYNRLKNLAKKEAGALQSTLQTVKKELKNNLKDFDIEHEVDGRAKSIYSLHKKLKKYNGDMSQIHDLVALRVIVPDKATCYNVLGLIHAMYQPMLTRIKDYIAVPKPNGYQSLHTTVITPSQKIVEIQIRSRDMHEHAERGLAAAFHYNESKLTKNYVKQTVANVPANLRWVSRLQKLYAQMQDGERIDPKELSMDLFADRIFVYTPRGDIFDLPEGSYPLDFAYAVHSEIGAHALSFKVNNKMCAFDKQLQNGDVVEVVTRKNITPKQDWLDCVTTAKARQKIRAHLGITSAKH